jgi:hypothetical protein
MSPDQATEIDALATEQPTGQPAEKPAGPFTEQVEQVGLCTWFWVELAAEGYSVLAETPSYAEQIVAQHRPSKAVQRVGIRTSRPTRGDLVLKQVEHVEGSEHRKVNYVAEGA